MPDAAARMLTDELVGRSRLDTIPRRTLVMTGLAAVPAQNLPLQQNPNASEAFGEIQSLLRRKEPITWVFTGDSITQGASHTMGWRSYSEHFAERVRWEMQRRRDIVINTGISGDRLPRLLADFDWRVIRFQPTVVSLMMGMNDCTAGSAGRNEFRRHLESCFERTAPARLLLHTPNLIHFPSAAQRKDLPAYVQILREFANERTVPIIDHYQHWSETRKNDYDLLSLLADGAVHPNQYGHVALARLIFEKLGIYDSNSRTGRLFIP